MTAKYLVALAVLLLTGCASPLTSTKEELQSVAGNEGGVIGSVLLTVPQTEGKESGWAFLGGRKTGELQYAVAVSESGFNPLKTNYGLPASPGKEEFFVKKLPAGNYKMNQISPTGFLAPQLTFPLGIDFTVKPQKVTYIGRLVVNLPDRVSAFGRFKFSVEDAQQETVEKLSAEHPLIVAKVERNLAGSLVPGNTVASSRLQRDTLEVITVIDGAEDKTCTTRSVINTESITKPAGPKASGEERWTVDRCGKTILYRVMFTPSERGGTDISVKPEK